MTVAEAPVRPRPPRAVHPSPLSVGRLLWLELRRNAMPWMFPLLAALFVFDPFRTAMSYPPLWDLRASVVVNKLLPDFVAFVAGVAAWMGSRDSRRHTADLVTATARPRWAAWLVTWAATAIWAVILYLCGVAVIYGVTATQATWGHPLWWPVAVGCAELAVISALGFAAGTFFPGRFTAPLAAVAAFFVSLEGFKIAVSQSSVYALLSPTTSVPGTDVGVFSRYVPDVAIAQLMFLAGLTVALLGVLGLARGAEGGLRLRRAAAVLTVVGVAAAGTAVELVGTAREGKASVTIPALHDAANDRPIAFTPVCRPAGGVPVCVHPAYRADLPQVTAALAPVLREISGLPGAPVRITEVGDVGLSTTPGTISGTPPELSFGMPSTVGSFGQTKPGFAGSLQVTLVTAFIPGDGAPGGGPAGSGSAGSGSSHGAVTPGVQARQAVQEGLLLAAGFRLPAQPQQLYAYGWPGALPTRQVRAAAERFAALPAATRHAWLAAHLAALRAGRITLAQLQ
jgi:hypothetical protein